MIHVGFQLWLNCCWHHRESSIYLCPYGSGVNSINFHLTHANVRWQWAHDGDMNHNFRLLRTSWRDYHPQSAAPALYLYLVALRALFRLRQ